MAASIWSQDNAEEAVPSGETLAACRTLVVESENWPQREQFLPALQVHRPLWVKKTVKNGPLAVNLWPTIPKSDRLLGLWLQRWGRSAGVETANEFAVEGVS